MKLKAKQTVSRRKRMLMILLVIKQLYLDVVGAIFLINALQ